MDKTLPRPRLGGSLFLGVSLPSRSERLLLQPLSGILERTLTWLHLSILPRTLQSTASPTLSKNLCRLGRSLSRLPGPSPNPLEEDYSARCM